jgi:hypothetical protein
MNRLLPISFSLLSLTACSDPFDAGSLIDNPRVLGVHVEVENDALRTTPRAGETAKVSLVMVGPEEPTTVRWALATCLPATGDKAGCNGEPLSVAQGTSATPELTLTVPSTAALGDASTLLVAGIVCLVGEPVLDDTGAHCVGDGADGTTLQYDLALSRAENGSDENRSPSLAETTFRFDQDDWSEKVATPDGCAGEDLPQVFADEKEHDLDIELGPDTREVTMSSDLRATHEELQVSHFVTAGVLGRQFSFVEPSDERERPTVSIKWTAPKAKELHVSVLAVRFVVVVRDMRGGIALVERSLCVVPTPPEPSTK